MSTLGWIFVVLAGWLLVDLVVLAVIASFARRRDHREEAAFEDEVSELHADRRRAA